MEKIIIYFAKNVMDSLPDVPVEIMEMWNNNPALLKEALAGALYPRIFKSVMPVNLLSPQILFDSVNELVKFLAKEKGYTSVTQVASVMKKQRGSFFSNLKYFNDTRNYQSSFARDLYKALSITEKEFREYLA